MTRSRYKAILFDWDDTLCYTDPHRYHHTQHVSRQFGHRFSLEEIYLAFARADHTGITSEGDWVGAIAHELGLHDDHRPLFREAFDRRNAVKQTLLYDDAVRVVTYYAASEIRIGILSNNRFVHEIVSTVQVEEHFEVIVSPDTYGVGKPNPAIFERTLADMNLQPEDVLYVGDSYDFDVVGARAAGITPVLVDRFGLRISAHHDAEHRLSSLEELHELVAGQLSGVAVPGD